MVKDVDAEAPASPKGVIPHDHLFKVTGLSTTNLEKTAQAPDPKPSDFEAAIGATSYGLFNVTLMLCALPGFMSAVSVPSSTSYIFTRAECDMNLSLLDMGTVSAMTYGGMISSAMVWGFLSDTLGRRRIMCWGFFGAGLVEMTAAMSQNFAMLLVTRFASGFLFNGPFAVLISYLAEMHRTELRARVILLTSLFYTVANILLPMLAWAIVKNDVELDPFGNGLFVIHAWNLFLLATALLPISAGIAFSFMPESPKFLMSRGRNDEAMAVFRRIYALNTRQPADTFPIKALMEEKTEKQATGFSALKGGFSQLAPLFRAPHGKYLLLMCVIHIGCMFGSNTIRLWYPQLSAMILDPKNKVQSLCAAIEPRVSSHSKCEALQTTVLSFVQSSLVGTGAIVSYAIGGALVNRVGKKLVVGICEMGSAIVIVLLPFLGTGSYTVAGMVTLTLALTSLGAASLYSITVDLFPTSLRVMAMAIFLMSGRIGTILGTVTFPALMKLGCHPPFITICVVLTLCSAACYLVPNTTLKKLE